MKKTAKKKANKRDGKGGAKRALTLVVVAAALILLALIYIVRSYHRGEISQQSIDGAIAEADHTPYEVPTLSKSYSNDTYGFSLKMPGDFAARESDMDDAHTVVFENSKSEGIQITISPYDEKGVRILTKDMIQAALPDLNITDDQVLEVGNDYRGLAFKSDNGAFDGDSREVWFIYKDNLYQISTYSRFDNLLKSIFATWQFK